MGANHLGEISRLCNLARPDYGLITNIGRAHLKGFGSFPNVIRAKSELYVFLRKTGGIIFQNVNNPLLKGISNKGDHIIAYGTSGDGNFEIELLKTDPFLLFEYVGKEVQFTVQTHLFGTYNLENLQAAITAGLYFKVDPLEIKTAIEAYRPENHRSQVVNTPGNQLFLDAYNANPSSMRLAIHDFLKIPGEHRIIILGDMFELGKQSSREHAAIVSLVGNIPDLKVILIGKQFLKVSENTSFLHFMDVSEAVSYFRKNPVSSCQILLKGSRMMQLEKLVPYL